MSWCGVRILVCTVLTSELETPTVGVWRNPLGAAGLVPIPFLGSFLLDPSSSHFGEWLNKECDLFCITVSRARKFCSRSAIAKWVPIPCLSRIRLTLPHAYASHSGFPTAPQDQLSAPRPLSATATGESLQATRIKAIASERTTLLAEFRPEFELSPMQMPLLARTLFRPHCQGLPMVTPPLHRTAS